MSYRVVWRRTVRDNIYTVAHVAYETGGDAGALSQAVANIELRRSGEPATEGESRWGAERALIVRPLPVVFEVFEDRGTVLIYDAVYDSRQRL
ncbi:hypothetical protein R5W24_003411 [Gemmata sp. JC717]|uniref:hypothetical protein n=1 Tax=Gemmata algarum TaxID=2975278 RepID=UPI0021BAEA44|nr:hypothetical protein [Gemmata algarum]MDY3554292.1 hypothetical protein [Gemmata algarum]